MITANALSLDGYQSQLATEAQRQPEGFYWGCQFSHVYSTTELARRQVTIPMPTNLRLAQVVCQAYADSSTTISYTLSGALVNTITSEATGSGVFEIPRWNPDGTIRELVPKNTGLTITFATDATSGANTIFLTCLFHQERLSVGDL